MKIVVDMPAWLEEEMARRPSVYPNLADRVMLAVDLSRLNVEHDTGGPFGAVVFE